MKNHIALETAKQTLIEAGTEFSVLFQHGTLSVELYKPNLIDRQLPHTRDETYVIAEGDGMFNLEGQITAVTKGDFLFVPAFAKHHFFDFSDNFATWVFFYGPEGGEIAS